MSNLRPIFILTLARRAQVEAEKARVAHELRAFIDRANAPIFGIDTHGRINEWNDKVCLYRQMGADNYFNLA
jgi:PAS domain-containing protein